MEHDLPAPVPTPAPVPPPPFEIVVKDERYAAKVAKAKRNARSGLGPPFNSLEAIHQFIHPFSLSHSSIHSLSLHSPPPPPPPPPSPSSFGSELEQEEWNQKGYAKEYDKFWEMEDTVTRINEEEVPALDFIHKYEAPGLPVVITNVTSHWSALHNWDLEVAFLSPFIPALCGHPLTPLSLSLSVETGSEVWPVQVQVWGG